MKRFTFMVLALLMVFSLALSACQPTNNNTEPEADESSNAAAAEETSQEAVVEEEAIAEEEAPAEEEAVAEVESENGPKYGGTLRIGTPQNPPVVGYTPMITQNSLIQFIRSAFNSLTFFDDAGNLTPELATSWDVDPEALTITFHLREGVKFSDGTDFNAEAVKWNIEEYQVNKRTEVANIESVEIMDDYTVVLHLIAWNSSTLESVGFFVYYMSPTAVQENGTEWAQKNPVGTGPFIMDEFVEGVSVSYVKNENYWDEGKPYLDGINFSIIADATTLSTSLQAGEQDLISYPSLLETKNLIDMGTFVRETNQNGVGVESTGVVPNSSDPESPFYDARVRMAFCYAIDAEALIDALGYGMLKPTNQWAAPGSKTYNPDVVGCPYNPEKAKELLAEAGYPDGFDTTYWTFAGDDWGPAIADMLTSVGIRVKLEMADGATMFSMMTNGWEGIMMHWASVGPDLGLFMGRHLDPNGAYYAKGIQHPQESIDLLEAIRTAPDEETKLSKSFELQSLIYDELALFGKVLYIQSIDTMKYPYVMDDNWTRYTAASWTPAECWLDQ